MHHWREACVSAGSLLTEKAGTAEQFVVFRLAAYFSTKPKRYIFTCVKTLLKRKIELPREIQYPFNWKIVIVYMYVFYSFSHFKITGKLNIA